MALRTILLDGDEALRKKCREVSDFGERTATLLDDLKETMVKADGLGLAAPQVGILRRAVVIVRDDEIVELVNPVIIEKADELVGAYEGCLSCPSIHGYVERPKKVKVKAQNRLGEPFELECEEMAARAACHEIDHLDGILFKDVAKSVLTDEELDRMLEEQEEAEEEDKR